ncbi:nucleoplasmin-like [Elgaria multicarinata webbii]|uniref:nucleoplasmin-like n=1 Tax=Elgaria multicarinata webbii TaxID=159646 RepID=UPI002FCD4243
MALEASPANTNESARSDKPVCLIWGCQLNEKNPSYTFDIPEEWSFEQQLALRTICLGANAKDEFNIVEIITPKDKKESTAVHIATLKLSVLPMATLAGLDLTPPVTFRLKSGSGPVFLAGQHVTVGLDWNGDDDREEEEEEEAASASSQEDEEVESSSKEESPVKAPKRSSRKRVFAAKKDPEQSAQEQSLGKRIRGKKPKGELRI